MNQPENLKTEELLAILSEIEEESKRLQKLLKPEAGRTPDLAEFVQLMVNVEHFLCKSGEPWCGLRSCRDGETDIRIADVLHVFSERLTELLKEILNLIKRSQ